MARIILADNTLVVGKVTSVDGPYLTVKEKKGVKSYHQNAVMIIHWDDDQPWDCEES